MRKLSVFICLFAIVVSTSVPGWTDVRQNPDKILPKWVTELSSAPVINGGGMAGIKLNDSEQDVLAKLGPPKESIPIIPNGNIIRYYLLRYDYRNIKFEVLLSGVEKKVIRLLISDEDFNKSGLMPKFVKKISVGSSADGIPRLFGGNPPKIDKRSVTFKSTGQSLPMELWYYSGIIFGITTNNNLIYLIQVPHEW